MIPYLIILLHVLFSPAEVHDLHLSVCEIEIRNDRVEITLKTFLDDLQIAVGITPGEPLPDDYTSPEEMIMKYVRETIDFSWGDLLLEDFSASSDAVWIEMSIPLSDTPAQLLLSNTFLTDIYRDQTNLVKIKQQGQWQTYTLDRKKTVMEWGM